MLPLSPIKTIRMLLVTEIALVMIEMRAPATSATPPVMSEKLMVLGGTALLFLITHAVGTVGLWFSKKWGRVAYTASIVLLIAYSVVAGPDPQTTLTSVLGQIEDVVIGVILCFVWVAMTDDFERPLRRAVKVFS